MARRLMVMAVVAAAIVWGRSPALAGACSCVERTPDEIREVADVVFVATSESGPGRADGADGEEVAAYRLRVERVYVGEVSEVIEVRTPREDTACGVDLRGRHLVYASRQDDGALLTGLCSGTRSLDEDEEPTDLGTGRVPAADGSRDEGAATPTTFPPIGGPGGDVEDPGRGAELLLAAVVVAALVAVVGGAAVRHRRTRA